MASQSTTHLLSRNLLRGPAPTLDLRIRPVEEPAGAAGDAKEKASEPDPKDTAAPAIIDDLPAIPAICEAELDAIERYMSDILDVVLGGTASPAS